MTAIKFLKSNVKFTRLFITASKRAVSQLSARTGFSNIAHLLLSTDKSTISWSMYHCRVALRLSRASVYHSTYCLEMSDGFSG